jgi:hypothetical protein
VLHTQSTMRLLQGTPNCNRETQSPLLYQEILMGHNKNSGPLNSNAKVAISRRRCHTCMCRMATQEGMKAGGQWEASVVHPMYYICSTFDGQGIPVMHHMQL